MKLLIILVLVLSPLSLFSDEGNISKEIEKLKAALASFSLLEARSIVNQIHEKRISRQRWLEVRDIIHQSPQIGIDVLLRHDALSTMSLNKIDNLIKIADEFMLEKKFQEAALRYQVALKIITKDPKFKDGRNYHLYWSLIHSLARTFYALKQFNDAFILYRSIPSSYSYYKQVQFELMWNNYRNERLEYSLGAIATMASGHFSKMLEPEAYLLQYYIYRRMCRDSEVAVVKERVKSYQTILNKFKFPLGNWIKKDVETLVYKQILQSGNPKGKEAIALSGKLNQRMARDVQRLKKEFDLVAAHMDLDKGTNKQLEPIKKLLTVDQLLANSNEKWTVEDNEIWSDELGKQVFIQKNLCKK